MVRIITILEGQERFSANFPPCNDIGLMLNSVKVEGAVTPPPPPPHVSGHWLKVYYLLLAVCVVRALGVGNLEYP